MRAAARAQPNIALIKYWGKRDPVRNLPAVGSISVTLSSLYTRMAVAADDGLQDDVLVVNGHEDPAMLERVRRCLDGVAAGSRPRFLVTSECNFPIAAGLASSASAFAALVVAADAALGHSRSRAELAKIAGSASGSAARSLYGGFVELRNADETIELVSLHEADQWPLDVVVAITATGRKPTGSGDAMEISRKSSPFYARWVDQQPADLREAREAIAGRDFHRLARVAEHNCLKMHSVMWSSRPPMVYWNSATLACLETVRDLQAQGAGVFFTIDAGPQVKAVCLPGDSDGVRAALAATPGVVDTRVSGLGAGAERVPIP